MGLSLLSLPHAGIPDASYPFSISVIWQDYHICRKIPGKEKKHILSNQIASGKKYVKVYILSRSSSGKSHNHTHCQWLLKIWAHQQMPLQQFIHHCQYCSWGKIPVTRWRSERVRRDKEVNEEIQNMMEGDKNCMTKCPRQWRDETSFMWL